MSSRIADKLVTLGRRNTRHYKFKDFASEPWHSLRRLQTFHNTNWTVGELLAWRSDKGKAVEKPSAQVSCVYCGSQVLSNGKRYSGNTTRACETCRVPLCKWCAAAWHAQPGRIKKKNRDTPVIRRALGIGGAQPRHASGAATVHGKQQYSDGEDVEEESEAEDDKPRFRTKRRRRHR